MAGAAAGLGAAAWLPAAGEGRWGCPGTETFHLTQGVLSHMAGKEVEGGDTDASARKLPQEEITDG